MISSLHFKLARTALGLFQEQLAEQSKISLPTIKKIESTNPNEALSNNYSTLVNLTKFYEDKGIEFINDKDSIGVRVGKAIVKKKFK